MNGSCPKCKGTATIRRTQFSTQGLLECKVCGYTCLTPINRSNKYGAVRQERNGYGFDSTAEARRYEELLLLQRAGEISDLEVHPIYPLVVNGAKVCSYEADFRYNRKGEVVVEDVKSLPTLTEESKIKIALMSALHNVKVVLVGLEGRSKSRKGSKKSIN